jgi:UDP-glucose 4-epimerase
MRVLVTGGAGYIGSQMVRQLVENKIENPLKYFRNNVENTIRLAAALLRFGNNCRVGMTMAQGASK